MQLIERASQLWVALALSAHNRKTLTCQHVEQITGLDRSELMKVLGLIDQYCIVRKFPRLSALLAGKYDDTGAETSADKESATAQQAAHDYNWLKHQAPLPLDFEKIIAAQSPNGDFATNALDVATNLGHQAKQASQEAYASMTEKYWPVIERVCREEIGPSALDAFRENKNISVLAKVIYSMLPFPFRILLNEDYFVDICLANRNRLLTLVEDIPDHKSADGGTKPE